MYTIIGITGKTGGTAAKTLLANGQKVRGVVRNVSKAAEWRERGAEIVAAELSDGDQMTRALEGSDGVYLNRKDMLSIEVLVEAVVVAESILQEQRGGSQLSCIVASLDEIGVALWIAHLDSHCFVPAIRDWSELRIECRAETMNDRHERVAEVFVFASSEAVASHDDAAAKDRFLRIERRDRLALVCGENARQQGASLLVEVVFNLTPIERVYAGDSSLERNRAYAGFPGYLNFIYE